MEEAERVGWGVGVAPALNVTAPLPVCRPLDGVSGGEKVPPTRLADAVLIPDV